MTTFRTVDDHALAALIRQAQRRIVFIAPGLFQPVAKALGERFDEIGRLEVTVILDADEDVCRIGFGELEALQEVHRYAQRAGFYVRLQPGLRVGVLLVDDQTLVYSPTPRSVELAPDSRREGADPINSFPNGMLLGVNPGQQIAHAVCAEGTKTDPRTAEIGTAAVTPADVSKLAGALKDNPPIPVDLARITRVFSTKLQFVELKVTRSKLSQKQIGLSSAMLNADASEHLRGLLDSKLRAFSELRDREVPVPVFVGGKQAFDEDGQPLEEPVSEAQLNRERHGIESEFLYELPGFGRVIERSRRKKFEARVEAYKTRLLGHADGMRKALTDESTTIVEDAVDLIRRRMAASSEPLPDEQLKKIENQLRESIVRVEGESPKVTLVYKEVTYEQTQDDTFKAKLERALPTDVKRRLGDWFERFTAARNTEARGPTP